MHRIFFSAILSVVLLEGYVRGDVIFDVQDGIDFTENTGVQRLDVIVSSPSGNNVATMEVSFQLSDSSGSVPFSPTAGVFGEVGMVGAGNITIGGSTFDNLGGGFEDFATLNLDFEDGAQSIPSTPSLVAQFFVDTNSLAVGSYDIAAFDAGSSVGTGSATGGSFTISAVPEPSGLGVIGIVGIVVAMRRRRST